MLAQRITNAVFTALISLINLSAGDVKATCIHQGQNGPGLGSVRPHIRNTDRFQNGARNKSSFQDEGTKAIENIGFTFHILRWFECLRYETSSALYSSSHLFWVGGRTRIVFKPHVDTSRGEDMFGSLVIVFPTPHEGGTFVLRDKKKNGPSNSRIVNQMEIPTSS